MRVPRQRRHHQSNGVSSVTHMGRWGRLERKSNERRNSKGAVKLGEMRGTCTVVRLWIQAIGCWEGTGWREGQQRWGSKDRSIQSTGHRCHGACSHSWCPSAAAPMATQAHWGPRAEPGARGDHSLGLLCILPPGTMSWLWPFLQTAPEPHWAKLFSLINF